MIITYSPEGAEPQHFDAGRGKLRASEIQIIERTADGSWAEVKNSAAKGDINAMRVIAWAVKKRTEPALRFGDFDPYEGELISRLDARETRAFAESLFEEYRSNPEELAEAFDELRDSAFDRADAEAAIADVTAPKDPATAENPQSPASPSDG